MLSIDVIIDVRIVTHGTMGDLAPHLVQDHAYQCCWWNTSCVAPCSLCSERGCGLSMGSNWEVTLGGEHQYWSEPHPICGAIGTCQYSFWGMNHWPWCTWPPLWSLCCCVPYYPLLRSYPHWCDDQQYWNCHGLRRGLKVFLKPLPKVSCRFLFVLLITIHLDTLIPVDYSAFLCDIFHITQGLPGGSWWCCLIWNESGPPPFLKYFWSFC